MSVKTPGFDRLCACGTTREEFGKAKYLRCFNCDDLQPIELTVIGQDEYGIDILGKRVSSLEDKKFDLGMKKRERDWYPKGGGGPT